MKKTLRNILALSLGLMTTIVSAQDWNADSRTRIDMSGDDDAMSTDQRVTLGTTWGGSDWGIHVSSDVNYTLGSDDAASMSIYEAYASADLMGYASLTAGRMAISNGSGALMSTRDWGTDRTTWEGMMFGLNLDMADITIGYHRQNDGTGGDDAGNTWINCAGEFSGWNVNLLYMTEEGGDDAATGIDISGEVAGAGVSASMNTDFGGNEMRVIGLSYAVNDDMGVNVSQTVYSDDDGFSMAGTNMSGADWSNGQMSYLDGGDEMLSYGLTYNLSGISLGATMHNVTSSDDSERDVTEISLGYSLGNNAGLSLSMADDNDDKYMWLTLNVGL
tara:strand:+ start:40 stop:1035 length:996 start_codon:yes stop_codon:yes gene_type:complete